MSNFQRQDFNTEFNHTSEVVTMFNKMGYNNLNVKVSQTNGLSIYVTLTVDVLNEMKTFADMFVYDNKTTLTVRISDHVSNIDKMGGCVGDTMNMVAFKKLIENGAIQKFN